MSNFSHKNRTRQKPLALGPIYTWRTLTGVKLKNNLTQYLVQKFFGSVTKALIRSYTKC